MINKIINKVGIISPYFISSKFVNIPFNFRHGKAYGYFENKLIESENWTDKELERYIITNFNKIFQYSKNFLLYKNKYKKSGVLNLDVKSLDDIKRIPILYRNEIRESISEFNGYFFHKTGGTSGKSLPLFLDKNAWAREWAHFHKIWNKADYNFKDVKFTFKYQKSKDKFIKYDFRHNEFIINSYNKPTDYINEFFDILIRRNIKYFHGYPSAIYDFLKEIDGEISKNQKLIIKQQIRCCFLSSEMPLPHITSYLKKEWNMDFLAWYGHSEVCILAASEINELDYFPLHTYGYVEVEDNMLLGTSYHNFDMPLIRYNTDDLVEPKTYSNGILKSFNVKEGRIFDFIYDKNNVKIPATALLRKEHHEIFKYIDYIQVFQERNGYATILVSQNKFSKIDASTLMNFDDINIDFNYIYLDQPIRTISGKVPLRIQKLPI